MYVHTRVWSVAKSFSLCIVNISERRPAFLIPADRHNLLKSTEHRFKHGLYFVKKLIVRF